MDALREELAETKRKHSESLEALGRQMAELAAAIPKMKEDLRNTECYAIAAMETAQQVATGQKSNATKIAMASRPGLCAWGCTRTDRSPHPGPCACDNN